MADEEGCTGWLSIMELHLVVAMGVVSLTYVRGDAHFDKNQVEKGSTMYRCNLVLNFE